jgi:DNA-binding CsgD family transcriptional regulator
MRLIEAALSDPDFAGIVVCGLAGVGKSRIAREALAQAESRGWEVRRVVGTMSARALPLGALASWVESSGPDTLQLVRGVIAALTSAPQGRPLVVGIDDAHLLDDLSVFVVHQIVARRAAKVVLTIRDGEPIPTGVQEVWKQDQFERLDLQPLSREEIEGLLSARLGGALDPEASERLWKLTRGNVLFLRNIVDHELASGRLAQHHGSWRWSGEPDVPPSLLHMIDSRTGALPGPVADVLDTLAVAEPLELAMLARITDPVAVEEAEARGLITLERVDNRLEVRLAHPLYGEVRRRRAPATRLRRVRGLVTAELAVADDRDDIRTVVRRAALTLDSDLAPDPNLLMTAAKQAVWLADHGLAERLADAAIRAGATDDASLFRAHALAWLGRGEEADEVFAGIDTSGLTDDERAALAFARAVTMLGHLGDPAGALTLIDDVSRNIRREACGSIDAYRLVHWSAAGKAELAIEAAKSVALEQLPDIVGATPAIFLVMALGQAGRTSEAEIAAQAGYTRMDRSLDSTGIRCCIADALVRALLLGGRVSEALEASERLREHVAELPGGIQIHSSGVAGIAAHGAGDVDAASVILEKVVTALATISDFGGYFIEYNYHPARTVALAMRGLADEAVKALATLEDRRHPSWRLFDADRAIAQAWVAACQGAVSEATKILLAAAESGRANGQFASEVMCLQTATQFGDHSCAPRLRELEGIVEGPRVRLAARFASALAAADGHELAAVSEEFERMGDLVAALDAAAHGALVYRQKDLRGSALSCSTRADELGKRCGASTPALRQASVRLPLTSREREIVMLLAEGLSTTAVAERLTLSARTIEGHIYRAMAKTGTASRDELAALLGRRRTAPSE